MAKGSECCWHEAQVVAIRERDRRGRCFRDAGAEEREVGDEDGGTKKE